jgi:Bacterial membrane protein YfhO
MLKRYWTLLILLALTFIFFHKLAFTDLILARGDTFAYFYPYWAARNAAFMQGHLPLWTPDLFMGVPLLANSQLGTFYPFNWPLTSFSPPDGIRLSVLFHIYLGLVGAYFLARRTLDNPIPALAAAAIFGLGGYVGAHVEQINQLQGIAWMPWIFLAYSLSLEKPRRYIPLLAIGIALQFLSGHTQTVFITAVGLGTYGIAIAFVGAYSDQQKSLWCRAPLRRIAIAILALFFAAFITLPLIAPQLIPMLELTSVSNRSGGLNPNQATAFSFNPLVIGRGLLPSYDGLIFGEYVAYGGIIGFGLMLIALLMPRTNTALSRNRFVWFVILLVGLLLALGEFNPLYWTLASLPGFNWFRVPARWLALFALALAMLAGIGIQSLLDSSRRIGWRVYAVILAVIGVLALSSTFISRTPEDVIGPAAPTLITWIGWGAALVILIGFLVLRFRVGAQCAAPLLFLALMIELFFAAGVLPYNHLATPDTYSAERFTISQLRAYTRTQTPPGRVLSISDLLFDPGDRTTLEARYHRSGLSDLSVRLGLVDTKMKEVLVANLPLIWNIPTIDGFDGGVLPTKYYTAFTSLMIPPGELRTMDGRLREILAREDCRGACIPDQPWLNLTNTRYLITDKIYDLWQDDIAYDTQFELNLLPGESILIPSLVPFEANAVSVLCRDTEMCLPQITFVYADGSSEKLETALNSTTSGYALTQFQAQIVNNPVSIQIDAADAINLNALTLVDTRTGDFQQLTLGPWQKRLSSDIKLYENTTVMNRAFIVYETKSVSDTDLGTENALEIMRSPDFDPARTVVISTEGILPVTPLQTNISQSTATITQYTPEQIEIEVSAAADSYLVLSDAYYPGWKAAINGESKPIYRADVMFRAVQIPAGESIVTFTYEPAWMPWMLIVSALVWLVVIGVVTWQLIKR